MQNLAEFVKPFGQTGTFPQILSALQVSEYFHTSKPSLHIPSADIRHVPNLELDFIGKFQLIFF